MLRKIPAHIIVACSAWISRILNTFFQLLSIRILLKVLGTEQYAVFVLLTGLMGWYVLSDIGLGISLQNFISECRAKEEPYNNYLVITYIIAIVLLLVISLVFYFVSIYIAPIFLKKAVFLNEPEKIFFFYIVGILYIIASIGSITYKVWYAEQKGYLSNLLPAIASLIALLGIWWVSQISISNKFLFSFIAFLVPPAFLAVVSSIWKYKEVIKKSFKIKLDILARLIKRAGQFWLFSIMAAFVVQIDYIIMSQFVSSKDIIIYNITTKVYALVYFVYSAVLMSLWPIFSEMIIHNHFDIIKKQLKKYIIYGVFFMIASTSLLTFLMPIIVEIISPGENIVVPPLFIILLGVYQLIRIWTDSFTMVLQSMSNLKPFWLWVPVQAILSILFQWALVPRYSIYGVILGLMGSFIFTVVWALPKNFYKIVQLSKGVQCYEH